MHRQKHSNLFDFYLEGLAEEAAILLQLLHDLRGVTLIELENLLSHSQIDFEQMCTYLEELGLVICNEGTWVCSWTGAGVANWRQQLVWAAYRFPGQCIPAPKPGENGSELGPPCFDYRSTLFAPGYCWCCRSQMEHSSEVLRLAEQMIRSLE